MSRVALVPRPWYQALSSRLAWAQPGLWPATLVLLLAGVLRVYRLADQNVWWDEGWTLWLAGLDPGAIAVRTAVDAHPPLHYLLMHYWRQLAGASAFSGRLFSVLAGLLMVAGLYRLGRYAGGARLGLLAAGLLALARFHVWWSQDIKNYTLAGCFTLLSVVLTLRLLHAPAGARRGWLWAGYVAASALGLFSHYLAGLIVLANNLYALLWLLRQWRENGPLSVRSVPWRPLAQWSLAQAGVLAVFVPWLLLHLRLATTWQPEPPVALTFFLQLTATLFSLGVVHNLNQYLPLVAGILALAMLGAAWGWRSPGRGPARRGAAVLCALIVLIPPLLIYLLSLSPASFFAPQITPRYLLMFSPAFLLLVALGLRAVGVFSRRLGVAALVVVVAAQAWTLTDYYRTRHWTDELYTLSNVINSFAQPTDGVLLHTDQNWPVFLYYLRAPIGWDGVLAGQPVDPAMAAGRAEAMLSRYKRVWVAVNADALAKDPDHLVEAALAERLPKQYEQVFGSMKLLLYAAAPERALFVPAPNFRPQARRRIAFGPELTLLGYDFPEEEARTGDDLYLVTYWQASQECVVQVTLVNEDGGLADSVTQTVPAGMRVRMQSALQLPPGASGRYAVRVRFGAQAATVDYVAAEPYFTPDTAAIRTPLNYGLGEAIRLVGYDLPARAARAGDDLAVTVFWESTAPIETSYKVFVHLVGSEWNPALDNPLWGQVDRLPLDGNLPTDAWVPGQPVPDPYAVPVDANAPPGRYMLTVGLYDALSGARLPVYDAGGGFAGDEIVLGEVEILPAE